jgi:hypothetical protein
MTQERALDGSLKTDREVSLTVEFRVPKKLVRVEKVTAWVGTGLVLAWML